MIEPQRKLAVVPQAPPRPPAARICPSTGVTIPECSCRRCGEEQIRRHAPWVLEPRERNDRGRAA